MANLQRLWSLLFFIVVIIIANAEPVRTDRHHEKSGRQREISVASASHQRPSHLDKSQHIHHRQSESSSHHRRRDTQKGRRPSQARHKKRSSRRSRHSYGKPVMDSILHHALHRSSKGPRLFFDHYKSPVFNSFHKYYRDQVNWMEKLRSQLVNRAGQLSGRLNNHQHGYRHSPLKYSNGHVHSSRHSLSNGYRTPSYQSHPGGKRQYKIIRNNVVPVKDIPEDVEVIGRPTVVETHGRPHRPSYTPNVWVTSVPAIEPHNCTKKNREPFHHTEIKSTSVSHNRNNFSPVHSVISSHSVFSGGKYHDTEEKGPHPFGDVLGVSFPGYSNVFSHPVTRIHDSTLPSGGVIPSIKSHRGTVRISFGSRGRPQKPSVEEHLNKLSSTKSDQTEENPCIKCPPDTRVEAPRGSDCVIAYPPSPLSCTPRFIPELRTVVTEGPAPGSLLPEGRYKMIITVWTSDSSMSTPVTTCNVNYDVEVRKCPALPEIGGAEVTCTAGRAWGSKCSWVCRGGRVLKGSSITTCTGHSRPHWTHPAPRCDDPSPEKPELPSSPLPPLRPARPPPSPRGNCPKPPGVPGGRVICELPSVEIIPRRDFLPKDEPAPSVTAGDSSSRGGVIRSRSVSTALALHPVGTSCKVECNAGLVLRKSEMDRVFLTCSPALIWNRSPPTCYAREPPMPRDNDCEDVTLTLDEISSIPLPVFFNVNGERAEVTCDIHVVKRGQHFVRKCKAVDQDLQTTATCQYVITVEPRVEFPSLEPDESATGGSAKNPKNTEYETVADVFRSKEKKHKIHTESKNKPDKISFVTKYQTEDSSGEDLSYFDAFGDRGHRPSDESYGVPRARSVLHQTEKAPRDIAETQIYTDGEVTTSTSHVASQTSATTEVDITSSLAHETHVPNPSEDESYDRLHSVSDVGASKILGRGERVRQHSVRSNGSRIPDSEWKNTQLNNITREVPLTKKGKNQPEVTRGEKIEETETAIMAATLELKILVDDCRNSNHVKKALHELLLMLESCKKLNCHTPKTKCRHRPGQKESVVKVSWTVGGPFEPLDDYYYDDVQVPVVETDIDSFMTTAERLIASERTTRAMEAFGAAVDLTSFSLNRLDLVCEDRTYSFDPQTNRCIKRKQQEL